MMIFSIWTYMALPLSSYFERCPYCLRVTRQANTLNVARKQKRPIVRRSSPKMWYNLALVGPLLLRNETYKVSHNVAWEVYDYGTLMDLALGWRSYQMAGFTL